MKLIFLDADGTLLHSDGHIPESTILACELAQKNRHKICLGTGRQVVEIIGDLKKLILMLVFVVAALLLLLMIKSFMTAILIIKRVSIKNISLKINFHLLLKTVMVCSLHKT